MPDRKPLTPEEISAIVDGFDPIDNEEMEMMAKMSLGQRWLVVCYKAEALRTDFRVKLVKDFPELSMPEINMKVSRSLTSVRMGRSYTEPVYYEYLR
jgi:hypothetical protein